MASGDHVDSTESLSIDVTVEGSMGSCPEGPTLGKN